MISSSNPKFFKKISNVTTSLVSSLTEFAEGSENHEICKAYALSQFSNSRFLDADSHKIERRIKGLCEKFIIHNQPEKAEVLENWRKKYLKSDLTNKSKAGSDIHYALLLVVLELSENPVNTEYHPPPAKVKQEEEIFDWKAYLLEGEDIPSYPSQWAFPDTPDASEDEGDDGVVETKKEKPRAQPEISVEVPKRDSASFSIESAGLLVPRYWEPTASERTSSNQLSFSTDTVTVNIPKTSNLSEVHIIREVLWVLAGCSDLFIFPFVNGRHTVRDEILITHASSKSFSSALLGVAKYADIVVKISNFIFKTSSLQSQTYQAFAESLLFFIKPFRGEIRKLEKKVIGQEETLLLNDVLIILAPKLKELEVIDSIFIGSIDLDKKGDSHCRKSCRLLGALYHTVLDEMAKAVIVTSAFCNVLIKIWVDTLRPYFEILDSWMSSGVLIDKFDEFVLRKSSTCTDIKSEAFWSEGFSLADNDCMKYLPWLKPVLNNVIVCGKSVELLKSLGKPIKGFTDTTLHESFTRTIFNLPKDENANLAVMLSQKKEAVDAPCDIMLRLNFERLFATCDPPQPAQEFEFDGNCSFVELIHRAVSDLIKRKHDIVNKALLDVFMIEFNLIFALQCFQKFHLMGWGDAMYDFTTSIFEKISNNEYWMDLMSLRASLQEAIFNRDPDASFSFLAVALNKDKAPRPGLMAQPINATDIIEIIFEVDWPLNIIITEKSKVVYNRIFMYIMQIKRALFCLERLKYGTIFNARDDRQNVIAHRLSLLRSNLLCLISHWHNFVMTSVIEAEKNAFMENLNSVKNIDEIVVAHEQFLDRMISLCLLKEEKQSEKLIQGTLRKIFDLAVSVHSKWKRIQTVSLQSLRKLESDYKECSEFLGVILLNLVSRGSVPLSLEALAFCLRT